MVQNAVSSQPILEQDLAGQDTARVIAIGRSWTASGFVPVLLFWAAFSAIGLWTYKTGAPMGGG